MLYVSCFKMLKFFILLIFASIPNNLSSFKICICRDIVNSRYRNCVLPVFGGLTTTIIFVSLAILSTFSKVLLCNCISHLFLKT